MSKNVLRRRWFLLASGSSVLVGLYNYFKPKTSVEASTSFTPQSFGKWDHNWDKRDVSSLLKPSKKKDDPDEQAKRKAKLVPTATRVLFLVRHGQYEDWAQSDQKQKLTPLGLEQAAIVGQRLRDLGFGYTRLVHSTMTRARETSEVVLNFLPGDLTVETSELLREGNPIPTEPPIGTWREEFRYHQDGPRIEAAFRKYFHRADPTQEQDSFEIIVCHANVIRYFVCRLLQVPPEAWLRFSLHHCSLTWVAIAPNGHVYIYAIGASGFLPKDKLTTV